MKISGVYKITNTVTGDFYIGSSKNVKLRWAVHKRTSTWNKYPNKQLYHDMQEYGLDKFVCEILEEVEADSLKEKEQKFIETLNPSYNNKNANGLDIERRKEFQKEYYKSEKGKESQKKAHNKYYNQLCYYNGETLTLGALRMRFKRKGIDHPNIEAKKYLLEQSI